MSSPEGYLARAQVGDWSTRFEHFSDDWHYASTPKMPDGWIDAFEGARTAQAELLGAGQWVGGPRSLLRVLGILHLERYHTAALAWLLDPTSRHGLGNGLLRAVLDHVAKPQGWADERVTVATEQRCEHPDHGWGFVDVLVSGETWSMVIENKVWATQHGPQLELYFDAHKDRDSCFVFLTPDGDPARSLRSEVVDAFTALSWRLHIIPSLAGLIDRRRASASSAAVEYLESLREEFG